MNEELDEWPNTVVIVISAYLRRNRRTYQIRANDPRRGHSPHEVTALFKDADLGVTKVGTEHTV